MKVDLAVICLIMLVFGWFGHWLLCEWRLSNLPRVKAADGWTTTKAVAGEDLAAGQLVYFVDDVIYFVDDATSYSGEIRKERNQAS